MRLPSPVEQRASGHGYHLSRKLRCQGISHRGTYCAILVIDYKMTVVTV